MNSYLPGLTDEYPAFAGMELVQEWGTCEQALRSLVSAAGWEQLVADLTGTVSYVDFAEPEEPASPETPVAPEAPETPGSSETPGASDGGREPAGDLPAGVTETTVGNLPRTGDPVAWVTLVAGAGATSAGLGALAAVRRRRRAERR